MTIRANEWLSLTPALLVAGGLFSGGLLLAFVQSLENPHSYSKLFGDAEFLASLALTFWVSIISTLLSCIGGVALGLYSRRFTWQVPLAVPHIVVALVLINLLAPSGLIARLFVDTPAEFPALLYDRYGIGIMLAYFCKEIPFIALITITLLKRIGPEYDEAARTLGASKWQRLQYVTLPMLAPGVTAAGAIVFAFVFSAFEVPFLLGRTYPAMLGVVAQRRFMSADLADRPEALALACVMTLVSLGIVGLLRRCES